MDKSSETFCFLLHGLILTHFSLVKNCGQNQKFFRPYYFHSAEYLYYNLLETNSMTQKYQRSRVTSRPEDGSSGFLQNAAIYLLTTWFYSPENHNLNILVPY